MSDGAVELCRVYDCDKPAAVLVDVELVDMNEAGVGNRGTELVAMCRLHALQETIGQETMA